MYRFAAALLALSVTQAEPPSPGALPATAGERAGQAAPADAPPLSPVTAAPPAPSPPPRAATTPAAPPAPVAPVAPARAASPAAAAQPQAAPQDRPRPVLPAPARLSERDQALAAALGFVDALLRGDAAALSAASAPRFSFDGEPAEGRDLQTRRWREIFASRRASGETLRDLIVMPGAEGAAQLGPPPPRVAALLHPEAWVAVADLSGRPVVLFLTPLGDRFTVAGMHD